MTEEPNALKADVLRQLFDLEGLGVVVTGAASGIGFAIAEVMAMCHATVTLVDSNEDALGLASAALLEKGLASSCIVADIADEEAAGQAISAAAAAPGGLQVVFANAGISSGSGPLSVAGSLTAIDRNAWDRVIAVNLTGVLSTIKAAANNITNDGRGRIIVTSSIAGIRTEPMVGYAYAVTKAGVLALVRQAALELAAKQIRINAITPGAFSTNIGGGRIRDSAVAQSFADRSALGRIGHPDEIRGLAVLLASPSSSYITGATFSIDGGTL